MLEGYRLYPTGNQKENKAKGVVVYLYQGRVPFCGELVLVDPE